MNHIKHQIIQLWNWQEKLRTLNLGSFAIHFKKTSLSRLVCTYGMSKDRQKISIIKCKNKGWLNIVLRFWNAKQPLIRAGIFYMNLNIQYNIKYYYYYYSVILLLFCSTVRLEEFSNKNKQEWRIKQTAVRSANVSYSRSVISTWGSGSLQEGTS